MKSVTLWVSHLISNNLWYIFHISQQFCYVDDDDDDDDDGDDDDDDGDDHDHDHDHYDHDLLSYNLIGYMVAMANPLGISVLLWNRWFTLNIAHRQLDYIAKSCPQL